MTQRRARVAVDLLGGDAAPEAVVDGALLAVDQDSDVDVVLVGPPDVAAGLLARRGRSDALPVVPATQAVDMAEDPVDAVRAKRDCTVRVAANMVRDGQCDAMVSAGSTGAAVVASVFALGRLSGVGRPSLAVTVPAAHRPVVLVDAGANADSTAEMLAQFALCGAAFAQVMLGVDEPRIGLLNNGTEAGKGDRIRRDAATLLAALPLRFAGNVESMAVTSGDIVDVVVADGFSGNVLLKGIEGMHALTRHVLAARLADPAPALAALDALAPDHLGGAVVLGVRGVVVIGHGASNAVAVASCIRLAANAARERLVPRVENAMAGFVAQRTADAGLTSLAPQQ